MRTKALVPSPQTKGQIQQLVCLIPQLGIKTKEDPEGCSLVKLMDFRCSERSGPQNKGEEQLRKIQMLVSGLCRHGHPHPYKQAQNIEYMHINTQLDNISQKKIVILKK